MRRKQEKRSLQARYLPMFQMIPNKNLIPFNLTHQTPAFIVDYDHVVVDTYDYLDKLIGFRMGDALFAAFDRYRQDTDDERAQKMCNYIRYGTDEPKEIMLLRYGFEFEDEDFEWIKDAVSHVDEDEMIFTDVDVFTDEQKKRIQKFI